MNNTIETKKAMNKDLILREKLALQRTTLANQSTFLAFLRTAMYFLIAGLSLKNLLKVENSLLIEIALFIASLVIFVFGTVNYLKHKKSISTNKKHIGDYQLEYYKL
jgi:putative membrane protein